MKAFDVTCENGQARERTQLLMDFANKFGGMVVGTGDLSELALGWATYNGDHMSMYGVNASVPKTLVRYIVRYEASRIGGRAGEALTDILATPVSPELLPATDGAKFSSGRRIWSAVRAARFLPVARSTTLRLLAAEDLLSRAAGIRRRVFRGNDSQMVAHVLQKILRPAVQALVPAGPSKVKLGHLSPRGIALHAVRCVGESVAEIDTAHAK